MTDKMAGHLEDKMQAILQDTAWIKKNNLLIEMSWKSI